MSFNRIKEQTNDKNLVEKCLIKCKDILEFDIETKNISPLQDLDLILEQSMTDIKDERTLYIVIIILYIFLFLKTGKYSP